MTTALQFHLKRYVEVKCLMYEHLEESHSPCNTCVMIILSLLSKKLIVSAFPGSGTIKPYTFKGRVAKDALK